MSLQCLYILRDFRQETARQNRKPIQFCTVRKDMFPPHNKQQQSRCEQRPVLFPLSIKIRFLNQNKTSSMSTLIVNPYMRPTPLQQRQISRNGQQTNSIARNNQVASQIENIAMGIQSQRREGAVRKCMKRGTKLKAKHRIAQRAIDGSIAFNPIEHCIICKANNLNARGIKTRLPKRSHHKACPKNRRTRGTSEMNVYVAQQAARNLAANRSLIVAANNSKNICPTYQGFFARRETNRKMHSVGPSVGPAKEFKVSNDSIAEYASKNHADPTSLRREMDARMKNLEKGEDYQWVLKNKYPVAIGLMADFICSLFEHRKHTTTTTPLPATVATHDAIRNYRQFFSPGSLSFTFPMDVNDQNNDPSPSYHLLEGETILHVDWKLAFPSVELLCYNCKASNEKADRHLVHDRTNFSKKKSLFPIWSHSGLPTWCVLMNYKCEYCKTCYTANDGRLLSLLPSDVASTYPVLPRYASGLFHLHRDLSDDVDSLMKTYANGKFVSTKLHRKMGIVFTRKVQTYLARSPKHPFVSYDQFSGGISPPTAPSIRQCFDDAEHSPLTPYGFSNFDRYERELQSVKVDKNEKVAFDWTFQTIKNYKLPGAKAIFTGNKGSTNEVVTLAIVPTTAVSQISHLLLQSIKKRQQFSPAVLYTDTCPHNESFWKRIFGSCLETKLGLFHLLHRIYDTLDPRCDLYWKCLVKLKNAVYTYVEEDEAGLLAALKDGSFSKTYEKVSDKEIRDLRHSKRWKQRYGDFLRKRILPDATIQHRLSDWLTEFQELTDESGRSVFTRNTQKVTKEQLKKVQHVADVPNMKMYQRIPPGPRSTHGLSKWKCDRPESPLEKFHELMAHFGNTGMHRKLADTLTLGGTTEYNVKQRWKARINQQRLDGASVDILTAFVHLPRFYDHSFLQYLNDTAKKCGLLPIFDGVNPIRENNGETFLSKYFEEQMVRNEKVKQDPKTALCLCPTCTAHMKNARIASGRQEEEGKNNVNQAMEIGNADNDNERSTAARAVCLPVVVQQQPATNNRPAFRPPVPLAVIMGQSPYRFAGLWLPRPHDCCYVAGKHHCAKYQQYLRRKNAGNKVLGKPPHDLNCPVRRGAWQR